MCGIAGGVGPSSPSKELLKAQIRAIRHRGPDDEGSIFGKNFALGMCRLAIVEIANGKQPALDLTEKIKLVWNGEIFNFKELRECLEKRGVHFRGPGESEVILNMYLEYGIDFVKKLNGMFALAIHDSRDNSLYLVRDQLGKKPLWYTKLSNGTLYFASEVRALMLARPDISLRSEMIAEVLQYGFINSPNSAFKEILQVPPASIIRWKAGKLKESKYWNPDFTSKTNLSYVDALDKTKEMIEAAVSRRLISERPIGSFLSGGYDSTVVTAFMAKLTKQKIQTYVIGFDNRAFNEANNAREVANYLGTSHHELILQPDPNLLVEKISKVLDQPFADSSIVPMYILTEFAGKDLVVALGGDGGDEVFGGYDRYLAAPTLQALNPLLGIIRTGLHSFGKQKLAKSRKLNRIYSQLSLKDSLAQRYSSVLSLTQSKNVLNLINPDLYTGEAEKDFISHFESENLSALDRMIRSDLRSYLPGDLLFKADIASMANSLELRSPLLDINLVEWGISLPREYRIRGLETKHILKDVARSLVPANLIDRPKKGFGIPRAEWIRDEMREMVFDTLTDQTATQRGWFNVNQVRNIINAHLAGKDNDSVIWPLLMLELWARTWLD
jgi:asparagine synthase (glutamine-hydrolysing)